MPSSPPPHPSPHPGHSAGAGPPSLPGVFRVILKRKAIIIITVSLSLAVSLLFLRRQEILYRARSSVEIEQYFLIRSGQGFGWVDMATEESVITSLPVAFEVAKLLGKVPTDLTFESASRREDIFSHVTALQSQVRARQRQGTTLIDIESTSSRPEEARDIANFTAQAYKRRRGERTRERAEQAQAMVRDQKTRLEKSLETAEQELNAFKLTHRITTSESALNVQLNRLVELEEKDQDLALQRRAALEDLDQLATQEPLQVEPPPAPSGEALSIDPEKIPQLKEDYSRLNLEIGEMDAHFEPSHPVRQDMKARLAALRSRLVLALRKKLESVNREDQQIQEQRAAIEAAKLSFMEDEIQLVRLNRKVERFQSMLDEMEKTWQTAELDEGYRADFVRIVQFALLPAKPVQKINFAPIASITLLGLILGIGLAFVREAFDFSLDNITEIEAIAGLPVLAVIPHFNKADASALKNGRRPPKSDGPEPPYFQEKMVAHFWPKNPTGESFRILRMAMRRGATDHRLFLVTSATPQEGKSFITSNLAVTFAQANYSTLLVEANTRRPTMHKIFPLKRDTGLTSIVLDDTPWKELQRGVFDFLINGLDPKSLEASPGLDHLKILQAGPTPVHPSETLEQLMKRGLLEELKKEFEVVIVDCPPILPVADASVIGPHVDGVVLVYRIGRTPRDMLLRALDVMRGVRANLVGMVLNDVDFHGPYYYPRYLQRYQYRGYTVEADAPLPGLLARFRPSRRQAPQSAHPPAHSTPD